MADPEDVQDDADEAQATAEDADARAEAAESNELPSGLTGAPPPEALPQSPAAPVGSVVNPPTGSPTAPANPEEARQQEFAAGQEGVTASQGRVSATEEGGDVEQRRLDAEEEARRNENIDRQADEQARIDTRDDFQKKVQAAEDNVKNFKFQDHYANESTARKAANAISIFFGGLGNLGGQAPGSANYALQALEQHEKEDYDQQLAYLNSAKYLADKKREGYTDLLKQQSEDRRVAELNFAAKRAAITDEFAAQASQSRNKTAVAAAQEEVARRKADVAKRQTDVFKDIETEKYQQARAQAALLKAQGKHRGAGGGSSTGDKGYASLLADLQAHPEYGPGEQAAAAIKFGVPTNAKAGRNSLKTALDVVAKGAGTGIRDERQIDKETEEFSKKNNVPAIIKKQQEIGAVLDEVKNAPHNPLEQALAVEKAVSSARGGAASKQALALALNHLGGKFSTLEGLVQGARTGELGQKQMDNFVGFLNNQLGTAQKEGKDVYDNFDKYITSQPPEKQAKLEAARGRIFSGLHGFGGGGGGQAQPDLSPAQKSALKLLGGAGFRVAQ